MRSSLQVVAAGTVLLAFDLVYGVGTAEAANICRLASKRLVKSCLSEVHRGLLLTQANCDNVSDSAGRDECNAEAVQDRREGLQTCKAQRRARLEACKGFGGAAYDPEIDPANFVATVDNPYFPLTPGTTLVYEGQTAEGLEHEEFTVTDNTRVILGVTCIEVRDIVRLDGEVIEDTLDWFAQDVDGNVWYFGENAKNLEEDLIVDLEGSWTAGVDGAKPGIIMKAAPAIGDFYRQEFALDVAEDLAEVLSLTEAVAVPQGPFNNCLQTADTTTLTPDALEHKFYCEGVGNTLVVDPESGERLELIDIIEED